MQNVRALVLALGSVLIVCFPPCSAGGPKAPTFLVAGGACSGTSDRSLLLDWFDNSDDDAGFVIQASTDGGVNWSTIAYTPNPYITLHSSVGFSATGYYPGLTAGSTRSFRVAATHPTLGQSDFSNTVSVTMPVAPT